MSKKWCSLRNILVKPLKIGWAPKFWRFLKSKANIPIDLFQAIRGLFPLRFALRRTCSFCDSWSSHREHTTASKELLKKMASTTAFGRPSHVTSNWNNTSQNCVKIGKIRKIRTFVQQKDIIVLKKNKDNLLISVLFFVICLEVWPKRRVISPKRCLVAVHPNDIEHGGPVEVHSASDLCSQRSA